MDLSHYLAILWRRKWIIVTTLLITELVVILGTLLTVPIYSASTKIRIASASSGSITSADYMYADRLMNTYVKLATTTPVLDELKQRLGLSMLPKIGVTIIPNTELIQITVEHQSPSTAALAANTLADILISQSFELYSGGETSSLEILNQQVSTMEAEVNQDRIEYLDLVTKNPSDTVSIQAAKDKLDISQQMYASALDQYEQARLKQRQRENSISVVEPATDPISPSKPSKGLNIALGFLVGAVGGLGLAFLFENVDTTIYTTDQIQTVSQLPIIGKIPSLGKNSNFLDFDENLAYGDAFRRLRTNILSGEFPIRSLLVTSASPKEGKSLVVANLAFAIAQSGRNVAVIDADMRIPTLHKLFHVDNEVGLSSILEEKVPYSKAIQSDTFYDGLHILTSGPLPTNPSELLGSDQMKILIGQLSHTFDIVILDAPAALAVADSAVIAPMVDAIAVVIRRGKTSSREVQSLLAQLVRVKARLIGIIVNRAELRNNHYYYNQEKASINK